MRLPDLPRLFLSPVASISKVSFIADAALFSPNPRDRLAAARRQRGRHISRMLREIHEWPTNSPGALNAWLLLVTTKQPAWRDPLLKWKEQPLTLGSMHEGFLYPDPLGFWAEVRGWARELLRTREPGWDASEALAVTALVHLGESLGSLDVATDTCHPAAVLFLDEAAWNACGWSVRSIPHHISDPHRTGQVYQGFWGVRADGLIVGKAPQHPSAHRFYRREDMRDFLRALPR